MAFGCLCGGMAHNAGDSMAILANLALGRHRGGSYACPGAALRVVVLELSSDRRPYTGLRVWLTEDRRLHSGRRGHVPSPWVPTVLGMVPQCLGLWHSGRDDRTGPEVMEETRSAGLTSRCRPGRVWSWWSYPFQGCRRPLSRGATWRRYESRRHSVTK
jgi:hypothetical protein